MHCYSNCYYIKHFLYQIVDIFFSVVSFDGSTWTNGFYRPIRTPGMKAQLYEFFFLSLLSVFYETLHVYMQYSSFLCVF